MQTEDGRTCHGLYDDGEVSFSISQSDVTSTSGQMSDRLQVAPAGLGELCGVCCNANHHTADVRRSNEAQRRTDPDRPVIQMGDSTT